MKFGITLLIFLLPFATYASLPPLPDVYVNEEEEVWYYSSLPSEKCKVADFPQKWKSIELNKPPVNYKLKEPEWVWTEVTSFKTIADARECGMLFSSGSPIWERLLTIVSILLGVLCGGYIVRKTFLKVSDKSF